MASVKSGAARSFVTATLTSKGQVTIPVEIRRSLGVKPGDRIRFERSKSGIRVINDARESVFEPYRGIGNAGIGSGRQAIAEYMRELRGYDEHDDLLAGH
jgi:antitoxin PrlF